MKKVIYVNGCSHSCGSEISYPDSTRTPEDLDKSWGGNIARKYNLVHYNDAQPGQCNHGIMTNTVHSILKLLDQYSPDEILVAIGWSSFDRTYFIHNNNVYRLVPGINDRSYFKTLPTEVQRAYYNYISGYDFNTSQNNFALTYFNTVNFLKSNHIDYYFFNAIQPVTRPTTNVLHTTDSCLPTITLFDQIKNDPNYLDPYNKDLTYFHYLSKKHDGRVGGRNLHFLEDAHTEWANLLLAQIDTKMAR